MRLKLGVLSVIIIMMIASSCRDIYTPKPRAYFRINYPVKEYKVFTTDCGYSYDCPVYAIVVRDSSSDAEPCWLNVFYLPFNAKLHLSYKKIDNEDHFYKLKEDARDFVYRHTVKADEIKESLINTENGVSGIFYELEGSTATAVQFFLTDSTTNFLRGALYFNCHVNRDSLDPVINYLKEDITRMINSFQWKKDK